MNRSSFFFLTAALLALGCTTPQKGPEESFEQFWGEFDEMYGGFDLRDVDWDDVYDRYRPLVRDDMSDDEFFEVLADLLAETDDGHVHLWAPGQHMFYANRIYRDKIGYELFDIELVREQYLDGDFETNEEDYYTLGTLEDGTTYLHLKGIDESTNILNDARKRADSSGKLILDLRHNRGGDMTWAFHALGEWTKDDRVVSYNRTRNGPERTDFSDWYTSKIEGRGSNIDFPVVVLIDRFTISAGERLVLALDAFDDVTFVGQPTNGSVATAFGREMLNGWYYTLAVQEVMNPDRRTSIEGVGFSPDFFVENDLEELNNGTDAVLQAALAL
jgi:C-terminal processing protease CtpA/Prc